VKEKGRERERESILQVSHALMYKFPVEGKRNSVKDKFINPNDS
jgi:hypothetical protein